MSAGDRFDREGHPTELTIARVLADELTLDGALATHFESCPACRDALDAARRFDRERALSPPPALRASPTPGRGRWVPLAIAAAAAAVVGVLLLRPAPEGDGFRLKGGLALTLVADDGGAQRAVDDGDPVRAGERLGFRVQHAAGGHLLVLGVDGRGETYPCHPQGPAPASEERPPTPRATALDAAVEFDATPGAETIVALLCDGPVRYAEVAPILAAARGETVPPLRAGCRQDAVWLRKAAP